MRRASLAWAALASLLAAGGALAACSSRGTEVGVRPEGSARALGMFSTRLPERAEEQARLALAQDARRRENRFIDAVKPDHLASATRVSQRELEAGLFPPEAIFEIGAQLFNFSFTKDMGFGGKDLPYRARFQRGLRGGPDATHCAQCHWRGGPAGAGDGADNAFLGGDGDRQSSALSRNPIALTGAGYVEILAREMTEELQRARESLLASARSSRSPQKGELLAKGLSFGTLVARPDGSTDARLVDGVDADLVVKPFGHKGTFATLRDAVEEALNVHHGMQSTHLVRTAPPERVGGYGRPDPDGDGRTDEIIEGQVSALTLYLAMQEVPRSVLPSRIDRALLTSTDVSLFWAEGRARFTQLGCAGCHVPLLPARSTLFVLPSRDGGRPVSVDLATHGAEPRLKPSLDGRFEVELYSDLKRHDMGPGLAEARADRGVSPSLFVTRPLWGVARSRPYLHDGRAPTLEDAIVLHGGEAQRSRDAFLALPELQKASVRVFLTSLTRATRIVVP